MAFTKIVGAGIHTLSNVHTHNINSSGIITATNFVGVFSGTNGDFSGDVTIDGNLTVNGNTTTLDTTLQEVDQLFVSANNTNYAGIITQTGTGNILGLFDGVTRVFNVADGGATSTGALTVTGDIEVVDSSPRIKITDSDATGNAYAFIDGQAGQLKLFADLGNNISNSEIIFGVDSSTPKMVIKDTGRVGIGTDAPTELIDVLKTSNNALIKVRTTTAGAYFEADSASSGYSGLKLSSSGTERWLIGSYGTNNFTIKDGGTGGDERFTIVDGTGAVGIGSEIPTAKLEIADAAQIDLLTLKRTSGNSGTFSIQLGGSDPGVVLTTSGISDDFVFRPGGTEKLRIKSDGKVGIGTDNPQTIFHISDNVPTIRFTDKNSTGVPDCEIGGAGGNIDISADINGEKSDSVIRFNVDGGEKVRIDASGRVGIGTDDPEALLHVSKLDGASEIIVTSSTQPRLMLKTTGTTAECRVDFGDSGDSSRGAIGYNHNDDALKFYTSGVANERLRIGTNGSVGIGTDELSSNVSFYNTLTVVGDDTSPGSVVKIKKVKNSLSNSTYTLQVDSSAHTSNMSTAGAMAVDVNSGRAFTINGLGNVGIGTDYPSAPLNVHKINGTIAVFGDDRSGDNSTFECIKIKNDVTAYPAITNDSSNDTLDLRSMGSVQVTLDSNNNSVGKYFRVTTNGEGSAGTELFRIDDDGNVGIGTDTPTNSSGYSTLSINGATGGQIELSGSSKKHFIWTNNSAMNIAAGYQGGSGYELKVYTDGGSTSTERVRIGDGYVSILDDTAAYYKPALNIKNTSHGGYGGAIIFTGEMGNGTEYTQGRIRSYGGSGTNDGSVAIEAGDLNEVARFKSGYMSIGGREPLIYGTKGLEISGGATTEIRLKNNNGGNGQADGLAIQKWTSDLSYIYDYDNSDMVFGVSNQSKLKLFKQGRLTLAPSGNTNGGNSGYALSIVQDGNYSTLGSATGTYPGIHIKSTSTGGGNGAAIFTPDNNWSIYTNSGQTGLAIAPSTTGASSDKVRLFVMQNGQVALGANTFSRIDQAHYNNAQLTVAGGGINVVPITSGTSSPQVRHTVSWYHAGPNSSYSYQHLVTSLWGGGSPHGQSMYIMGGFTIKGYRYSPAGCSNEDIFFHNWGGTMHGYSRSHRGTWDPGNAAYIHSSGYVALRLSTGTYYAYNIDLYQFSVYDSRNITVTTVTYSNNTSE